eukprot:scaffold2486_cov160-Amphora_coffeaeformis.AAC.3
MSGDGHACADVQKNAMGAEENLLHEAHIMLTSQHDAVMKVSNSHQFDEHIHSSIGRCRLLGDNQNTNATGCPWFFFVYIAQMLPYRVIDPDKRKCGSRRKSSGDEPASSSSSSSNDHAHGGALQRALTQDLREMREVFLQGLGESVKTYEIGNAFLVCKTIFRERRVAAWQSRFVPHRSCDRASWSQLIYASCLALLPPETQQHTLDRETTRDSNTDQVHAPRRPNGTLAEAAFAIFSLYILHETNPLPRGEKLQGVNLLCTGLRNRENSKIFYRRHFRPWIRIDATTFASLCHWREEARAQQSSTDDHAPNTYLDRLIAEDVLSVLENLWDQLDFVSYTGPRGLEAMAGHPDYPYQSTEMNDAQKDPLVADKRTVQQENDVNRYPNEGNGEDSGDLQKYVQKYLESRQSIRIPVPVNDQHRRRVDRLRQALNPMFSDAPGTSIESILSKIQNSLSATTVLQSKPRMVTFSIVESAIASRRDDVTEASRGKSIGMESTGKKETGDDNPRTSYELVLPLGTSAPMKKSLETAIEDLLERDSMALVGSLLPTVSVPADGQQHHVDDGVSTLAAPSTAGTAKSALGGEAIDYADDEQFGNDGSSSIQTSAGRKALASLLTEARSNPTTRRQRAPAAASSSVASVRSNVGREALRALLEQVEDAIGSSVTSDTGQKALHDLFDLIQDSSSVASLRSSAGRNALKALLDQVQNAAGSSADSTGSATGRKALQSLLEQVHDESMDHGQSVSSQQSEVGPRASQSMLAKSEPASPTARRPRYSQSRRGMNFLTDRVEAVGTATDHAQIDDLSDVSGGEEDDFSMAMSSMGRRAIQELLDSAESENPKRSKSSGKNSKKRQKEPEDKRARRVRSRTTRATTAPTRQSDQSHRAGTDDERSTFGNDALHHLLSQAKDSSFKKS